MHSWVSGISLLGIPTENYVYGMQYVYICVGVILCAIIAQTVYLPVFHNLQITSTYEVIFVLHALFACDYNRLQYWFINGVIDKFLGNFSIWSVDLIKKWESLEVFYLPLAW